MNELGSAEHGVAAGYMPDDVAKHLRAVLRRLDAGDVPVGPHGFTHLPVGPLDAEHANVPPVMAAIHRENHEPVPVERIAAVYAAHAGDVALRAA